MTGGDAYKQKLLTDEVLNGAIAAYRADLSTPAVLEIGTRSLDIAAADLANASSVEVLAREGTTPQKRNTVKTATLLAPGT
ncbi:hypothetical protein VQ02_08340 [Methylobacterium variabile]|jgi:hypothetical protein|uniref:Uncharacterized protein n=1 Tax=Methylobacterium variabile TaxID=298794 RepID=A0A0J6T3L5_9HYPH|nr:hypothetical protein [Methylobacterium variabile]KMO40193.1 hypothetical protein VQ02_08340 [Methylobacterium variabile]